MLSVQSNPRREFPSERIGRIAKIGEFGVVLSAIGEVNRELILKDEASEFDDMVDNN